MKKITLALCACAFALTGLLASCSNESTSVNYVDVGSHKTAYKYAVKGTITTTSTTSVKEKADTSYGFTTYVVDKNGKLTESTSVTKTTVTNGVIDVSYSTNENEESNYKNYTFGGDYSYTSITEVKSNTRAGEKQGYTNTSDSGTASLSLPTIKKIGDDYYFVKNSEAKKIEEFAISDEEAAFDGDFGEEFTLTLKFSDDYSDFESWLNNNTYGWTDVTVNEWGGWNGKPKYTYSGKLEDTDAYKAWEKYKEAGYTNTSTAEYKLTFYPLQEFDPEAEVEEDEE